VSGKLGPPTVVLAGVKVPSVGCEFVVSTASDTVDEVPPLGYPVPPRGLVMERLIEPVVATTEAEIEAVT